MNLQKYALIAAVLGTSACIATTGFAQETLEEVTVTAQRRAERQQDVPISISTLSSGEIEKAGVVSNESLPIVVPG